MSNSAPRRYSTTGMGSADASFTPTTPGRAAKRMPASLMNLKKESNSRKYDIGVLATPGRKKLPVLAGGLAGGLAGSKAPAFCTPTRQRNERRQGFSAAKPTLVNLDDSDPSLDDEDERSPDLRRGLRGSRRGLSAKGSSLSDRRLSLSLTKGAPSGKKLMGRSKSHGFQGGLDSRSDHIPRHSFTRPLTGSDHEPQQLSRVRRRMSLGGPMQRPSNDYGTSKYTESTGPSYAADVDIGDDISIDDTVGDGNHKIAVTHTPRGSVKKRNTLVCTTPGKKADILPAPSTPGKKATRPNLGEHGKSPSKRVPKQSSVEKTSPTKRQDKKEKGPNKNIVAEIESPSKRAPKKSSLEKTSPTKRHDKKEKGPNKNIVAEIDAMDISAISVDDLLVDLGHGDDTGEHPDEKPRLPRRSKSTGSAAIKARVSAKLDAGEAKKQGEAQKSTTDDEEKRGIPTEGGLGTTQVATEAPVPSKQALSLTSSHQEVIAVEVSPVICGGGSVILRPPSATWLCTCGHTADKSDLHCGMCGTKQLWTCIDCMYTENLCIYSFCTTCGTKKANFLEQANAQAKTEPAAPCSPSSVMGAP